MSFSDLLPGVHAFRNRVEAGKRLAMRLEGYKGRDVLVLGIPRGGVPVAAEIAHRLEADLDIVVARKLGAPHQPELAIGAVTSGGGRYLNEALIAETGATEQFLQMATAREISEAQRREDRLRGSRPPPRIEGRVVIVVDDGLATGATMRAAVRSLREGRPSRLIVAIPVAPRQTCAALRAEADEVVALIEPDPFVAVGIHYRDFTPTSEQEIQQLLSGNKTGLRHTEGGEHRP